MGMDNLVIFSLIPLEKKFQRIEPCESFNSRIVDTFYRKSAASRLTLITNGIKSSTNMGIFIYRDLSYNKIRYLPNRVFNSLARLIQL